MLKANWIALVGSYEKVYDFTSPDFEAAILLTLLY